MPAPPQTAPDSTITRTVFPAAMGEPLAPPPVLLAIDFWISVASLLLAAALLVGWWKRGNRSLLDAVPVRRHTLREDAIAWAVLAYMGTALLLYEILERCGINPSGIFARAALGSGAHLGGIAACLWIAAFRFQGGVRGFIVGQRRIALRQWLGGVVALSVLALGLCPLARDATIWLLHAIRPDLDLPAHETLQALHDPSASAALVVALWAGAGLIAPVAEELFFRGLMQTLVAGLLRRRGYGILLTSLVFGGIHWSQPHAVVALAVLAVILGYAYERYGSLLPPIAIHMVFNLKTLVWDAVAAASGQ